MNVQSSIMSHEIVLSKSNSLDTEEPFIPKTKEPIECEPVPPRKTRRFFRTYSTGSLYLPSYAIDYLKTLPPPSYIYMMTIDGKHVKQHVYMSKEGERFIINDECQKVYLQDMKGLYRYDTM